MSGNDQGPQGQAPDDGQEQEFEPEFFDFTELSRRTKNMHSPKLTLEIGSYFGVLSALAADQSAKVATEALGAQSGPTLFNVARLRPGSKDLVAFPTKEKGPSTIEATWPEKEPGARLDLQYLLQAYPVKIPKGHRAFVPVARHVSAKYGPGILFKFSEISYGRITARTKPAGQSNGGQNSKGAGTKSGDKGKQNKKTPPTTPTPPDRTDDSQDQQGA